jgi:hypothetical protein
MASQKNYYMKNHNDNNILHLEYFRNTIPKDQSKKYQSLIDLMEITTWRMKRDLSILSKIEDLGK